MLESRTAEFLKAWGPVLLWCSAIFWLSSRPGSDVAGFLPPLAHGDKLAHALAFAVGAFLLRRALRRTSGLSAPMATLLAFLLATLYGASDELHQALGDAGREPDPLDLFADALGAALAVLLHHAHEQRRRAPESLS